jgi:hypothetical protein
LAKIVFGRSFLTTRRGGGKRGVHAEAAAGTRAKDKAGTDARTSFAEKLNLPIRVATAAGQGTAFKVIFPARREEVIGDREPAKADGKDAVEGVVLVVDDEEIVRKVAKAALEIQGYRVILASAGKEAVEVFRGKGRPRKFRPWGVRC